MKKEKPILFNAEMVRAILDGRKTMTRRIVKPRQLLEFDAAIKMGECSDFVNGPKHKWDDRYLQDLCPYGSVGDELWVRETMHSDGDRWWFSASGEFNFDYENKIIGDKIEKWCLHQIEKQRLVVPSIHMPRWASRIQLKITDIRVERVQEITDDDALNEGIDHCPVFSPKLEFSHLWNSINTKPGKTWDDNPWVWVVEFERVK